MNDQIKRRLIVIATLVVWGGLILWFKLVQFSPYGMEEGAARALLLVWSLVERVHTSVVFLNTPDFRALIFVPLALYWTGSLFAAKIFSMLTLFAAMLFLYRWTKQRVDAEVAMIASGLLLIAPISLQQIDAMGSGVTLLLLFGLGHWLDQRIRAKEKLLTAWYFVHIIVIAAVISIHPIGLGYALGILWSWHRQPISAGMKKQMLIGVGLSAVFVGLLQAGWIHINWLANPITVLGNALLGTEDHDSGGIWFAGIAALLIFIVVVLRARKQVLNDGLASCLALCSVIGLLSADQAWALIFITTILYLGTEQLIRAQKFGMSGFLAQRGLALALLFIIAFVFMQADKVHHSALARSDFGHNDRLIETLVNSVNEEEKLQVSSQWPGRTMLALKQAAFPLPPAIDDDEKFLEVTTGLTHIIFDHTNSQNTALARQIARLSGSMRTVSREPGGVIIEVESSEKE